MDKATHLYIHLPFCASRCGYCDFYSETGALGHAGRYVGALLMELEEFAGALGPLETIYLGGGTPTLIGAELLEKLLEGVMGRAAAGAEVTVEANPSTVTAGLAERLGAAGVNRFSLGVQSFSPQSRASLERAGEVEAVSLAVSRLRAAGVENIGLDMIFGIPGQSREDLLADIARVLELSPAHISYYELTAREGGAYRKRWGAGLDTAARSGARFYEDVVEGLTVAGYEWYETSNFARPGRECRHNLAYWAGEDYVGLGAGAWSTLGQRRWQNPESLDTYMAADGPAGRRYEDLSARQKARERFILGMRRAAGVGLDSMAGVVDGAQLELLEAGGFLERSGAGLALTRRGRFMGNEVCARLMRDPGDS